MSYAISEISTATARLIINTDTTFNIYSLPPYHHHYLSLSTKSKVILILIFKITVLG